MPEISLQAGIEPLGLNTRVQRALQIDEITTVAQLISLSRLQLLRIPGLGRHGVAHIVERLAAHNLTLADFEPIRVRPREPRVGDIVHYWNPQYSDDANWGVGKGPYAAIVTKTYPPHVSLSVFTHGKTEVFHIAGVPKRGSEQDRGDYPAWAWPQ